MESQYSIKDLESLSGIQAHTIRIWEKRYGVLKPGRSTNNFRYYDDNELRYFLKLAFLNKTGIKISKLASFTNDEINEMVVELQTQKTSNEIQIDALIMAMTAFNEEKTEDIIHHLVSHMGLEDAIIQVLFPFLNKVGTLWSTGVISSVQEHFAANIIRQKIMFATSTIARNSDVSDDKTFILFTFPGDLHDIGLLFTNYLIRINGFKSIYLGVSVQVEGLIRIQTSINPGYIFTQNITHKPLSELINGISEIRNIFTDATILMGGNFEIGFEKSLGDNTKIFRNFNSFRYFLKEIQQSK